MKKTINRLLDEVVFGLRINAVKQLARIRSPKGVAALATALRDRDMKVRWAAVSSLERVRSGPARKLLCSALSDGNVEIRQFAAGALGRLRGKHAVAGLRKRLRTERNSLACAFILDALSSIRSQSAVPEIIFASRARSPLVRAHAIQALGELRGRHACAAVQDRLSTETSKPVLLQIYGALYKCGQRHVLPHVFRGFKSTDYQIRCATAYLLTDLADRDNLPIIRNQLRKALRKENTIAARSSIETALQNFGDTQWRSGMRQCIVDVMI